MKSKRIKQSGSQIFVDQGNSSTSERQAPMKSTTNEISTIKKIPQHPRELDEQ